MPMHQTPLLRRGTWVLTTVFGLVLLHGCGSDPGPVAAPEPTVEQSEQQQRMLDFVKSKGKTKGARNAGTGKQ